MGSGNAMSSADCMDCGGSRRPGDGDPLQNLGDARVTPKGRLGVVSAFALASPRLRLGFTRAHGFAWPSQSSVCTSLRRPCPSPGRHQGAVCPDCARVPSRLCVRLEFSWASPGLRRGRQESSNCLWISSNLYERSWSTWPRWRRVGVQHRDEAEAAQSDVKSHTNTHMFAWHQRLAGKQDTCASGTHNAHSDRSPRAVINSGNCRTDMAAWQFCAATMLDVAVDERIGVCFVTAPSSHPSPSPLAPTPLGKSLLTA